jgi:long-chain fatty acid transport protein
MTRKTSAILRAAAYTAISSGCASALATNGYFPHGYGISAKGMGGASVAMAQDGFAGANNPAAAAFAGRRYEVGAEVFMPERGMQRTFGPQTVATSNSERERFLVPEFGYNLVRPDRLALGLTVYGNGGMNTQYPVERLSCDGGMTVGPANVLCGPGKLGVDLMQLVVAPTVAWQFTPGHAVGVSPLLVYQRFQAQGLEAFGGLGFSSNPAALTGRGHDSSSGVGLRLGYQGRLSPGITLGASYSPKVNMGRFKRYAGLFANGGDFDIPANVAVGVALQLSPALTLAVDHQRIDYAGVASVGTPSNAPAQLGMVGGPGFGWKAISVWKVGVQWEATPALTLRAGYNRGDNPVASRDVTFNILAPGVMTQHFTLGMGWKLDARQSLNFAYMRAPRPPGAGNPGDGAIRETIFMRQSSVGVQYSRTF